jgi:lipopolysaccharide/colanic/teichoic acid biosynthesis glycosyltransferase
MKRFLDLTVALFGLILLSPLILVLIVLIRQKLGFPVLHGKPFKMIKFRTMTNAHDAEDGCYLITSASLRLVASYAPPALMNSHNSGTSSKAI